MLRPSFLLVLCGALIAYGARVASDAITRGACARCSRESSAEEAVTTSKQSSFAPASSPGVLFLIASASCGRFGAADALRRGTGGRARRGRSSCRPRRSRASDRRFAGIWKVIRHVIVVIVVELQHATALALRRRLGLRRRAAAGSAPAAGSAAAAAACRSRSLLHRRRRRRPLRAAAWHRRRSVHKPVVVIVKHSEGSSRRRRSRGRRGRRRHPASRHGRLQLRQLPTLRKRAHQQR